MHSRPIKMSERLFIVTGASRGIGKAIVKALASSKEFSDGKMHFVLSSTKKADLEAAAAELEALVVEKQGNSSNLKVYLHPIDFSSIEGIDKELTALCALASTENKWKQVTVVINHGSLGGLEFISNVSSDVQQVWIPTIMIQLQKRRNTPGLLKNNINFFKKKKGETNPTFNVLTKLTTAINVNVTSCILLASTALKTFVGTTERLDIVNISSLAAIKPFAGWGVYCIGKAAREMMVQVIATEIDSTDSVSKGTQVRALCYSPGPVNTDMQKEIRSSAVVPEQRKFYAEMFETGKLVTVEATSARMVGILEKNTYQNGAHVDFYDTE